MPPQDPLHNITDKKSYTRKNDEACDDIGDSNEADPLVRPDDPRPPGERERFEGGRVLRESQARVLTSRRRSFLVQFTEMKGPPQIALLMILLAVGLGSTIGVVPAIMSDRFARIHHGYDGDAHCSTFTDNALKPDACFQGGSDAQAAAALVNLVNNSLTFLTASLTGSLSDEYGRKGLLMMGLTLSMIPSFFLCVMQDVSTMSPWWYYSTSASTGLVSWVAIALSALNDVLPPELRAPGIGLLFAGLLLGICVSPSLALFLDRKSLSLVSFGVVIVGFLMTVFVVPETVLPREKENAKERRKEREALETERDHQRVVECEGMRCSGFWRFYYGSSLFVTIRRLVLRPFWEMSILNRNCFFRLISALAFFTGMVTSGDQVLLVYYLEEQLSFDVKDISLMFLIIGLSGIFVQVVVMKHLNDAVGEKMVVALSFVCGTITNLLYGTARHKSTIFVAVVISSISTMAFPTISAIKANNVESSEQGRIQGALYSVKSLASGVGPALMQLVYNKTKDHHERIWGGPGSMFIAASALFVIGIGLALALPKKMANTNPRHGGTAFPQSGLDAMGDDEALGDEYQMLTSAESQSDDSGSEYGSI